jgi:pimeloyl-ACP methyl ester carboxylesterase
VLVGHSFGGPVVKNFAMTYPRAVAGMVFVDAAHEGLRVGIGGKKTIRLGDGAKGISIPPPHEGMSASDAVLPSTRSVVTSSAAQSDSVPCRIINSISPNNPDLFETSLPARDRRS